MTTVVIKKKNGQLIEKTIVASTRPKATPETTANISREIKERKKLVPDKKKRMAVINLAKSKSLSFDDALQIINKAEEGFVIQKAQAKLAAKERRKLAKKSNKLALKFAQQFPATNLTKKKLWVSIVSGGGGPALAREDKMPNPSFKRDA